MLILKMAISLTEQSSPESFSRAIIRSGKSLLRNYRDGCIFKFLHSLILIMSTQQNSEGHIAMTSDLWSDGNLRSFMAIMGHYLIIDEHGSLVIQTQLLAF